MCLLFIGHFDQTCNFALFNLTICPTWLEPIGHFDKGDQVFVQFDWIFYFINRKISCSSQIHWSKIQMSLMPHASNQNGHVH